MLALPPIDTPLHCINESAIEFHVPAKLIMSVLLVERGKLGQVVKNKNGSYDIGPMQINSTQLPELLKHGITQKEIQYDACTNVRVGVWILSKKIAKRNNLLVGIGDYNSHTDHFNKRYYNNIRIFYTKLNILLET